MKRHKSQKVVNLHSIQEVELDGFSEPTVALYVRDGVGKLVAYAVCSRSTNDLGDSRREFDADFDPITML